MIIVKQEGVNLFEIVDCIFKRVFSCSIAVPGVLSYLMYFQETDEQIESFQALVDDPLSQYEQFFLSSGKEESTPLEQDWMIMSIEAV